MSSRNTYAVFGLGRYGQAVAKELSACGMDVLAVDMDEAVVNSVAQDLPYCKCADITNADVIRQLGIADVDVVIVAMANSLEASVMAITLCKEVGVKTVIAKCGSEMHKKIFTRIGADRVVFPEYESGTRLAKNLLSSGFVDMIELSQDVSMVELDVLPEWSGKNLIELNLRKKFGVNVVAVRNKGDVLVNIDPAMALTADMSLIVIGHVSKLGKLSK
jgi:trk system potassium uptake protein TrkA